MKKERKPGKALAVLTRRLIFSMTGLWLVCMLLMTWIVAEQNQTLSWEIAKNHFDAASFGYHWGDTASYSISAENDPVLFSKLVNDLFYSPSLKKFSSSDLAFQPAVLVKDADGSIITSSGAFLHGPLETGEDVPHLSAALEREYFLTYDNGNPIYPDIGYSVFWSGLRLTGFWEEASFRVLTMEYLDDGWHLMYQVPDADLSGAETVTLNRFHLEAYDYGQPVTRDGITYASLNDYLVEMVSQGTYYSENTLWDSIYFITRAVNAENGNAYTLVAAIQTWPLLSAFEQLRWFYLGTFGLAALLTFLLWYPLKKKLVSPIREIGYRMSTGWDLPPFDLENKRWFSEATLLADQYNQHQHDLYHRDKELARLNKALDYAKEAEESRRQMTSSIAHELKTPLAVIHSYAEGLKEHIAEEKRDRYLDVILSECEQMDGMVLEMLDLSRLEAGKVKLARDTFSLAELTTTIFEKLELAVQAKELQVRFDFCDDDTVTADEARISQVITNFATNAVKYTNFGGQIVVRTEKAAHKTRYIMENECPPLSREALSKVWDTFYRTDSARSGGGTGLGLAIAKSIIELHGGSCAVQNTLTGVAFRFVI